MEPEEAINVETTTVRCDGGGGPLGHPSVYLKIGAVGDVVCPYCSRHFLLEEGAAAPQNH
jgi:uncharacterized Zn-finger protein